jgi:hypothetical protein
MVGSAQSGATSIIGGIRPMAAILWTVVVIVLLLWLLGFVANIGPLIHLLLIVALVLVIVNLLTGRRVA